MKILRAGPMIAFAVAVAAAAPAFGQEIAPGSVQSEQEAAAIRGTVEAFKQALRSGNTEAALAQLHPEVRVFEAGHAETRTEYAEGHLAADMAFLQAVESATTEDRVDLGGDMALYESQYTSKGEFRGREIDSHGTETMVLVRSGDGWKILHIHWSSR